MFGVMAKIVAFYRVWSTPHELCTDTLSDVLLTSEDGINGRVSLMNEEDDTYMRFQL